MDLCVSLPTAYISTQSVECCAAGDSFTSDYAQHFLRGAQYLADLGVAVLIGNILDGFRIDLTKYILF